MKMRYGLVRAVVMVAAALWPMIMLHGSCYAQSTPRSIHVAGEVGLGFGSFAALQRELRLEVEGARVAPSVAVGWVEYMFECAHAIDNPCGADRTGVVFAPGIALTSDVGARVGWATGIRAGIVQWTGLANQSPTDFAVAGHTTVSWRLSRWLQPQFQLKLTQYGSHTTAIAAVGLRAWTGVAF